MFSQSTSKCAFIKNFAFLEARCVLALLWHGSGPPAVCWQLWKRVLPQGPAWEPSPSVSCCRLSWLSWLSMLSSPPGPLRTGPTLSFLFSYFSCIIGCKISTCKWKLILAIINSPVMHWGTAAFLLMESKLKHRRAWQVSVGNGILLVAVDHEIALPKTSRKGTGGWLLVQPLPVCRLFIYVEISGNWSDAGVFWEISRGLNKGGWRVKTLCQCGDMGCDCWWERWLL